MDKIEVCNKVAEKLFAAEHAVDEAMVRTSQLIEGLVEARRELGLSAVAGEIATARTAESIAALAEARRAVMAAHSAMQAVQRKLGVPDDAVVGIGGKTGGDGTETLGFRANLRVASSQ